MLERLKESPEKGQQSLQCCLTLKNQFHVIHKLKALCAEKLLAQKRPAEADKLKTIWPFDTRWMRISGLQKCFGVCQTLFEIPFLCHFS